MAACCRAMYRCRASVPDRPPVNFWMPPHQLLQHRYVPGQIILGKFGGQYLGHLDDRPMVMIAGARAGKTSTVLEPNLCLYPGSMMVLDPKCELASLANLRRAFGHNVPCSRPFRTFRAAKLLLQCAGGA